MWDTIKQVMLGIVALGVVGIVFAGLFYLFLLALKFATQ